MEPPVTGDMLRAAMRHVPSPVTVVTAVEASEKWGITIGSLASVSLDPPLVSFNVQHQAQMHDVLGRAEHFAINVLGEEQAPLAVHFAVPNFTSAEQFDPVRHRRGEHGLPVLCGVVAVLYGRVHSAFEAGDHSVFIGAVTGVERGEGAPLLYYQSAYHGIGSEVPPSLFAPVKRSSNATPCTPAPKNAKS